MASVQLVIRFRRSLYKVLVLLSLWAILFEYIKSNELRQELLLQIDVFNTHLNTVNYNIQFDNQKDTLDKAVSEYGSILLLDGKG